jgi:type VII secretion protein EccB
VPLNLASRTQVSGHYFLRRRLQFALLRRSVRMQVDPVRWQRIALMLSGVVAAVLLILAFVIGWMRPAGVVGGSKIVADRKTGALYVSVDGRLHPALNLVSAQLISGEPDAPTFVSADDIAKWPKGPVVGIDGAPIETPAVSAPDLSRWAVCDTAGEAVAAPALVTGIDGALTPGSSGADTLSDGHGVLLAYQQQNYLVNGAVRMPLDLTDRTLTGALSVDPGAPVPVMSQALFDALPAGAPLVVPTVPNAGAPAPFDWGAGVVIGSVVVTQDVATHADKFYAVVGDGVQPISPVVAAMLRQRDSYGTSTPPRISPDRLAQAPIRHVLDVDYYPAQPLKMVDQRAQPVTCVAWERGVNDRQARISVLTGRDLPIASAQHDKLVPLVGGGTNGVQADQVLLADAPATFVSTTGSAPESPQRETMWLISDSGVRYGVPFDQQALQALGLATAQSRPAPWAMLQVWPAGPELSRTAALTVHDSAIGAAAPVTTQQPALRGR